MIIERPILKKENGYFIVSSICHTSDKSYSIWYRINAEINLSSDIFLIACLLPSMKVGEDLEVQGEVSFKLYNSIEKIQNIYSCWFPEYKKINIISPIKQNYKENKNDNTATFFTGGVDSFYTLLKRKDEIDKIIYVHGFDIPLSSIEYRTQVNTHIEDVANNLNKQYIKIESNLREFSDNFCNWGYHYHGSALASVAILLQDIIGKIYIPSSYNTQDLFPWGTHPDTDALWSTEDMQIIHDKCEARIDKIKTISNYDVALNHLRVCWQSGLYNCSKCEKCIRTMIGLYAMGVKCATFDKLDAKLISELSLNRLILPFAKENYDILPNGDVKSALKIAIDNCQ